MFLQREEPVIPVIHKQMRSFLQKLASKFVAVQEIKNAKGNFRAVKFKDQDNQLSGNITICTLLSKKT